MSESQNAHQMTCQVPKMYPYAHKTVFNMKLQAVPKTKRPGQERYESDKKKNLQQHIRKKYRVSAIEISITAGITIAFHSRSLQLTT